MGKLTKRLLALLGLLFLAGCFSHPTGPGSSSTSTTTGTKSFQPEPRPDYVNGCLFTICNANETSHDYKLVYDKLGLRQINFDRHRELGVGMDGQLVAWQIDRRVDNHTNWDNFAYNITQDKLYAVGWESYYTETLFEVSHGRIVFTHGTSPEYPDDQVELPRRAALMLWDEATQERRILNTGLGGGPLPSGFDGSWVVFENSNSGDTNRSGLFAMNVDTGEVIPLYVDGQHPGFGTTESTAGPTVVDGFAYYEVHNLETTRHFWLHEVNLTTREDRIVHEGPDYRGFAQAMRSSDRYVVWFADYYVDSLLYMYDRETGEGGPLTDRLNESLSIDFSVAGDWAVYQSGPAGGGGGENPMVAIHIPTRTRIVLVEENQKLYPGVIATNGEQYVVSLLRNDHTVYEQNGEDLYWGNLRSLTEG